MSFPMPCPRVKRATIPSKMHRTTYQINEPVTLSEAELAARILEIRDENLKLGLDGSQPAL